MTNTPDRLTAATEAEFAQALDQAIATGQPVEAPIEVVRAFGVPECDEESAETADWRAPGPGSGRRPATTLPWQEQEQVN